MFNLLIHNIMEPKIIFKDGREGEMTLDAIKGIAIPRIDGETILVYPKYKDCILLDENRIRDWKEPEHDEIDALFVDADRSKEVTDDLLALDSPAAKHVRSVGEQFNIPSLLTVGAIWKYRKDINALAKNISGADLLRERSCLWSCCRYNPSSAWVAYGNYGFFSTSICIAAIPLCPCRILKNRAKARLNPYSLGEGAPSPRPLLWIVAPDRAAVCQQSKTQSLWLSK